MRIDHSHTPPRCGLYSFRAQNKAERLKSCRPWRQQGSRRPASFTRVPPPPVTREIEVLHAACRYEFQPESSVVGLTADEV